MLGEVTGAPSDPADASEPAWRGANDREDSANVHQGQAVRFTQLADAFAAWAADLASFRENRLSLMPSFAASMAWAKPAVMIVLRRLLFHVWHVSLSAGDRQGTKGPVVWVLRGPCLWAYLPALMAWLSGMSRSGTEAVTTQSRRCPRTVCERRARSRSRASAPPVMVQVSWPQRSSTASRSTM